MDEYRQLNEILSALHYYKKINHSIRFPVVAQAHGHVTSYKEIARLFVRLLSDQFIEHIVADETDQVVITEAGISFILNGGYKIEEQKEDEI